MGVVAGTAIGAVVGGLAGKSVAEQIDPTNEDGYWQAHHARQVYGNHGSYDRYKMAYRTGYEGVMRHGAEKSYFDVEDDLKAAYEKTKEQGGVTWEHAKHATREAFDRARASGEAGLKKGFILPMVGRAAPVCDTRFARLDSGEACLSGVNVHGDASEGSAAVG